MSDTNPLVALVTSSDFPESVGAIAGAIMGVTLQSMAAQGLLDQLLESYDPSQSRLAKWIETVSKAKNYRERLESLSFGTPEQAPPIPPSEVKKYLKKKDVEISEHVKPQSPSTVTRLGVQMKLPATLPRKTFLDLLYLLSKAKYKNLTPGGMSGAFYEMFGPYYDPYKDLVEVSYHEDPGVIAHEFGHAIQGKRWKGYYLPLLSWLSVLSGLVSLPGAAVIAANTGRIRPAVAFAFYAGLLSNLIHTGIEVEASLLGQKLVKELELPYKVHPSGGWFARLSPLYPYLGYLAGLHLTRLFRVGENFI